MLYKKIYTTLINTLFPQTKNEMRITSLLGNFPLHMSTSTLSSAGAGILSTVTSLGDYGNKDVATLIYGLKYAKDNNTITILSSVLGDYLLDEVAQHSLINPKERVLILPIPLSAKRFQERGFNQVEILLETVAKEHTDLADNINTKVLIKHKETLSQTRLTREERLINIKGAFSVEGKNKSIVTHAHVIVIDDVVTTGATTLAAVQALKKAGAAEVQVIALARTL